MTTPVRIAGMRTAGMCTRFILSKMTIHPSLK